MPIEKRQDGVEDLATNVFEIDIDTVGTQRIESLLQRLVFVIYGSVHTEIAQDATLLLATRDGYHPASQDAPDLHNG